MSRPRALVFACTCLVIAASFGAAPSVPNAEDPFAELRAENARLTLENHKLKLQIDDLNAKNRDLQRRLTQPGARVLPAPAPNAPRGPNVPQPFQMPGAEDRSRAPGRDWTPREFNGQTIYIVPCDTAAASTGLINGIQTAGTVAVPTAKSSTAAPAQPKR